MEQQYAVEAGLLDDLSTLASWNRPRTNEEISSFLESREALLGDLDWEAHE